MEGCIFYPFIKSTDHCPIKRERPSSDLLWDSESDWLLCTYAQPLPLFADLHSTQLPFRHIYKDNIYFEKVPLWGRVFQGKKPASQPSAEPFLTRAEPNVFYLFAAATFLFRRPIRRFSHLQSLLCILHFVRSAWWWHAGKAEEELDFRLRTNVFCWPPFRSWIRFKQSTSHE